MHQPPGNGGSTKGNTNTKVVWRGMPFHGGVRHHECLGGRFARTVRSFL
jgi:hypothetical protein